MHARSEAILQEGTARPCPAVAAGKLLHKVLIVLCPLPDQALDAGTTALLPEGLRTELEALEDAGGVRHLTDLKAQIQVGSFWHR